MAITEALPSDLRIFIGFDSREEVATEVAAHSIKRRSKSPLDIKYLKHRELRKSGHFSRPWMIGAQDGEFTDLIDGRPFSTEFSHTRFLVPALTGFKGWALFMDADMIFLSDISKLFALCDNKYAAMVVKHNQPVKHGSVKMDGRQQAGYYRKNWSSFVLWNCGHPANQWLSKERVNMMTGSDLHSFSWLSDNLIGSLPATYNFIKNVSPPLPAARAGRPDSIHYTDGGPWFAECQHVAYAQAWLDEYADFQENRDEIVISHIPSIAFDKRQS